MEIIIPLIILLLPPILLYNSMIGRKNNVENAFSGIDTFLKQRYDELPNIIKLAKAVMTHEKDIFTKLAELRSKAVNGTDLDMNEKIKIDNEISKLLGGLKLSFEAYPELNSYKNFLHAQGTLNNIEANLNAARRSFNHAVTDYNNGVEMFPTNIVARMLRYQRKELFIIPEEQRQNIDVNDILSA